MNDFAEMACLSKISIVRFENGQNLKPANLQRLRETLEERGIVFDSDQERQGISWKM